MTHTRKPMTLAELAAALGGTIMPAATNPGSTTEPSPAAGGAAPPVPLDRVGAPADATPTTLLFAEDARALLAACAGEGGAVVTTPRLAEGLHSPTKPLWLVPEPKLLFSRAARLLRERPPATGVHPRAEIAASAILGTGISIGPFAVVDEGAVLGDGVRVDAGAVLGAGCVVGEGSHIYPRAVLYPGVVLGRRNVVHAGAVLGADGFGYVRDRATGAYEQFPQQGRLVLEDDVEVGANTTIDRGALAETRLERGSKLDNLVHVGHNVRVGSDVVIAAQTGISGSSTIGAAAVVAGQVGIADHVEIGPGAILGAQCGVPSNKQLHGPGVLFWGTPARPITQYLKELATLSRLTRAGRGAAGEK